MCHVSVVYTKLILVFSRRRSPSPRSEFSSESGPSGELVRRTERAAGTTTSEERVAGTTIREERAAASTTTREERDAAGTTTEDTGEISTTNTNQGVRETDTGVRGRNKRKIARINTPKGSEDEGSEDEGSEERLEEAMLLA